MKLHSNQHPKLPDAKLPDAKLPDAKLPTTVCFLAQSYVDLVGYFVGAAEIQPNIESTCEAVAQHVATFPVVDVYELGIDDRDAAHLVHQQVASHNHHAECHSCHQTRLRP